MRRIATTVWGFLDDVSEVAKTKLFELMNSSRAQGGAESISLFEGILFPVVLQWAF